MQEVLADRGILGTSILWFEAWDSGALKDPGDWRREVLASVTVHDLPPTAGYLRDEHVRIRAELGLLTTPEEVEREHAARERAGAGPTCCAGTAGSWPPTSASTPIPGSRSSPSWRCTGRWRPRLRGCSISLPDVAGDRRAQNQPGTDQEYPNWRVPMTDEHGRSVLLEDLLARPDLLSRIIDTVR